MYVLIHTHTYSHTSTHTHTHTPIVYNETKWAYYISHTFCQPTNHPINQPTGQTVGRRAETYINRQTDTAQKEKEGKRWPNKQIEGKVDNRL